MRHNEIRDELLYLIRCAFTSSSVSAEPLIRQGRTRSDQEIFQGNEKNKETQGGVMVLFLWDRQVDAMTDVNLGDADADSYKNEPMTALLARKL